jgi:hypothetical protein
MPAERHVETPVGFELGDDGCLLGSNGYEQIGISVDRESSEVFVSAVDAVWPAGAMLLPHRALMWALRKLGCYVSEPGQVERVDRCVSLVQALVTREDLPSDVRDDVARIAALGCEPVPRISERGAR